MVIISKKKPSILCIEDIPELAEIVGEFFEEHEFRVVFARTAHEALAKTDVEKFDCILSDINLEKGTGDQVIMSVRSSDINPNKHTPVIVLSSALDEKLVKKVRKHIQGAFVKPYDIKEVFKKTMELIKNK